MNFALMAVQVEGETEPRIVKGHALPDGGAAAAVVFYVIDDDGNSIPVTVDMLPGLQGHIVSSGLTPAVAAGAGAGTSPTVSVSGNDTAGVLNVTTGTSPGTAGTVVTVTFATAFDAAPRIVLLSPANAAAAALPGSQTPFPDVAQLTAAHWILKSNGSALAASTAYQWFYHVIG